MQRNLCGLLESAAEHPDNGLLGARNVVVAVGELPHHPAGQDLVEGAVEDGRRELRIEIGAELAALLPALDDVAQRLEGLVDLFDLLLQVRATRDLAYEHADEVRVVAPCTEDDRGRLPQA